MVTPMNALSPEEKNRRLKHVRHAIANAKLEGYEPTKHDLVEWERYIRGEQSLEQTITNQQKAVLNT